MSKSTRTASKVAESEHHTKARRGAYFSNTGWAVIQIALASTLGSAASGGVRFRLVEAIASAHKKPGHS